VLLSTASVTQALELSVFPSLLLITTLFRLALNISATRLILGNAPEASSAGKVIEAFGSFVIGGNPVVGIIIFVILIVIQFVVITAGAGRVAEVAARFTLDAMPGKQMAIDADLNAGLIDDKDARRRRQDVSREADFYGAMDGASKFVRGDAIAAIIMIIINVLGGFAVGVWMHGLPLMDALNQYTTKTVGEGIVTQIPALIMSISTGLIVTRASAESDLGKELSQQIGGNPQTLLIVAGILFVFMLVPGFPKWPFLFAILILGGLAYWHIRTQAEAVEKAAATEGTPSALPPTTADEMSQILAIDPIEMEVGYGLIYLADPKQGGELLDRILTLRKQIAHDLGFVVPPVRVRDNIQLKSNGYVIKLWDVEVTSGEIIPRHVLAINPGDETPPYPTIPTIEPAFGLPARWVPDQYKLDAEMAGCTVVDPTTVLITHLSEVIKTHAYEVLTRQDVQELIDRVRAQAPALVDDLVPKQISLSETHRVLQGLLKERVPIRDMNRILSALSDNIGTTRDVNQLTEFVRQSLARMLSAQYKGADGTIEVFTLDPDVEEVMINHLRPTQFGTQVVLDPGSAQRLLLNIKSEAERALTIGNQPILLCSSQIRPYLRRLIEKYMPSLTILSHTEITPGVQIKSSGTVTLR
jgi:flagellar biosynthesis protein FlhA